MQAVNTLCGENKHEQIAAMEMYDAETTHTDRCQVQARETIALRPDTPCMPMALQEVGGGSDEVNRAHPAQLENGHLLYPFKRHLSQEEHHPESGEQYADVQHTHEPDRLGLVWSCCIGLIYEA